jgi:hypothetical protein
VLSLETEARGSKGSLGDFRWPSLEPRLCISAGDEAKVNKNKTKDLHLHKIIERSNLFTMYIVTFMFSFAGGIERAK